MISRRKLYKAVALASAALPFLSSMAVAQQPLSNDSATQVAQKILVGALTIEAPSDVSLPDLTVNTDKQLTSGELTDFKVNDARGHKASAQPGWTVTATMTNLSDGAAEVSMIPFSYDYGTGAEPNYTMTMHSPVAYFTADVSDVVLGDTGTAQKLVDTNVDGTSDAFNILSAAATLGRGLFDVDMTFDLQVPPNSDVANYSSTVTYTIS